MGIKKCKRCKKIFAPVAGAKICPKCLQEEEDQFVIVKDYLWDYPGSTIAQLHEETGVDEKIIRKFAKEGRFLQINGVEITIDCERCGAPIKSGRFCQSCSDKLRSGIEKVKNADKAQASRDRDNDKMFLGDRIKKRR
ncbi:flagellar operon protein (TIGR03826 family) [Orenia metallireducens]|uniref:Flagellar operon protein TIGR03826 n=1 Tax=Orenia metallireducens TaxID=1413210 RepID=A0A285GBX3_9FIRM|nr:flagellar protein [Orenia metallireducens]PRX32573.1 flagellar operon protein (TIGR03826 family) [Orenia metallireducens]SNY20803.1 flagellar operon protein TIGR03826 [Orenia metallireducens]